MDYFIVYMLIDKRMLHSMQNTESEIGALSLGRTTIR